MKHVIKAYAYKLFLGLSLLFSISVVHAQDVWYQVEVIVFEDLQGDADGETWPVTPGYPDTSQAVDFFAEQLAVQINHESLIEDEKPEPVEQLNQAAPTDSATTDVAELQTEQQAEVDPEITDSPPPVSYQQLDAEEFRIADVFSRMKRSARYRPLLHLAWYQSGDEEVPSQPVRVMLNSDEDPDSITNQQILDGTVTLRKSRFIHMQADLVYFLPASMAAETGSQTYASLVRLQESRKMRLNELHYMDHPLFGVVVYVSPLQID